MPIKKPNNKGHAKKDPIGLHPRWPKATWASYTLHMGQRRYEYLKTTRKTRETTFFSQKNPIPHMHSSLGGSSSPLAVPIRNP